MGIAQWIAEIVGWELSSGTSSYNSTIDNIIYTVAVLIVMFCILYIFRWLTEIVRGFFK